MYANDEGALKDLSLAQYWFQKAYQNSYYENPETSSEVLNKPNERY